jgi:molybdopterin/thiamine biosynthesis adenylyltransferase
VNDYLKRFRGRVDRRHVAPATIAVVGVGLVGARIALELARLVPKRLILVDGDDYEEANLSTHPLPAEFIGWNKSVAMAEFLQREVPGIQGVAAIPYYVDPDASDERLIADVIEPATILIVATDRLDVQRHIALLARAAEVPAIVPGVAEDGSRGEAFLSLTDDEPCLACFDGYRPAGSAVRGAAVVALDASPAVHLAFNLALSVLDGGSREAERLLSPLRRGGPVPQLFRAWPPGAPELAHADDGRTEATWREGCP